VGPVLTLPLLAVFAAWRSRRTRTLLFLLIPVAAASSLVVFFQPHDISPATVLFYAAIMQGMRALNRTMPGTVRAIPLICAAMIAVRVALAVASVPPDLSQPKTWARNSHLVVSRDLIAGRILEDGGQHLVIVHYGPGHDIHAEYVYNAADIDASPVVWARDMGPEKNAELVRYFSSRKVWWLNIDIDATLSPYPPR